MTEENNMDEIESNSVSTPGKYIGRVKWYNKFKKYGFVNIINEDLVGTDAFCHISNIQSSGYKLLFPGEFVSFDVETNPENNQLFCTNITGVLGNPLMADNDEYIFKVFPKNRDKDD